MSNFLTKEDAIQIMQGISKKTPQGIMIGNTTVGHIEWQMYLMRDYLKLDGTPLANASNDYSDLLKFAQDNSLITSDTTDKALFKYDSTNDVLTLPDYIGLCLQGGNTVEEKEAGLPNIEGTLRLYRYVLDSAYGCFSSSIAPSSNSHPSLTSNINMVNAAFDASASNPIYGNSTTVQPPAITLIPQIKYKRSTTYEGIDLGENYSTEEQRIGTWIDGKPLYQKTYSGTTPSTANTNTNIITDSLFADIDMCYVADGYIKCDFGVYGIDFYSINESRDSSYYSRIFISGSESAIRGSVGEQFTSRPIVITIKYTKTTD